MKGKYILDGVTILSTYECSEYMPGTFLFIFLLSMIGLMFAYIEYRVCTSLVPSATITVITLALTFALVNAALDNKNNTWNEYSVTISDEVLFNEFYNKYQIIKTDGSILRVKER